MAVAHRVSGLRGDAEELLQMLTGDQAASADLDVGQVAAAHLVVEQVAGQAGQPGGLIDGVGQPPAVRVLAGGRGAVVAERRRIRDAPGHVGWFRFPVVASTRSAGHWPASGSGRSLSRSCRWRGVPGWEARLIASDSVRPSSSAQPWMKGQSWWRSFRPCSLVRSARVMAVMALLRSRARPGSQDTSHWCWLLDARRAVCAVWSLVMVASVMVRVMVRLPGRVRVRGCGRARL